MAIGSSSFDCSTCSALRSCTYVHVSALGLFCVVSFFFTISPVNALNTSRRISQYGHTAWRGGGGVFFWGPHAHPPNTGGDILVGSPNAVMWVCWGCFFSW